MKLLYPITLTTLMFAASSLCAAEPAQSPASAPSVTPVHKDMVILFDTTMENMTLADRAGGEAKAAALKLSLESMSTRIKAWGARHGVGIDTFQFNGKEKIDISGRTYQYMLLEKITMEGIEDTSNGPQISGRQWEATSFVMNSPKDKPMPKLGHAIYHSDEVDCFGSKVQAKAQEDCQGHWLKTLSTHLQWANPAWPSLAD